MFSQPEFSNISSRPGAFSRMGFGARGLGMGNAMSSIITGNLVAYYNPALSAFQETNSFQSSYSFLSFDRNLNFLNFTRNFKFGLKQTEENQIPKPKSVAGLSIGIINAGVDGIEERDNQGIKTGDLSTSENQILLGLANRFSEKLALGVSIKFYYYKLYEDISSTSIGFDIGGVYIYNDNVTIAFVISDVNSKYEWDTTVLYGQEGNNTVDKFPVSKKIGIAYNFIEPRIVAAVEFENSNAGTNFLRIGGEYNIFENLFFRGGLDKFHIGNLDIPVRPSFGFSYFYTVNSWIAGIDYAFVIEPYSAYDQHIVGVNINF